MRFNSTALRCAVGLWLFGCVQLATAAVAIDQITDINNTGPGFGNINLFANPPIGVNDTGVFMNNNVAVFTLVGGATNNGAGVSIGISNGENGIDSTDNGANVDIPNATPADPVFSTIGNASGKLENGNAIRFSMWMRQDPLNPVTKQPNVEPVVKVELWKEAVSGNADFNAAAFPGFGDRLWDTDQNASNAVFNSFNQSQASWVDMNNNGVIANGQPVAVSLVTAEWRLVEAVLIVDDDPLNDGLGWSIGAEFFTVADVEEIRPVMFVGDFGGPDLTNGGSFFIDNLLLEVFANEAAMLATPNPNSAPVEIAGLLGDYNGNNVVDAADYAVWRDNLGSGATLPGDTTPGVGLDDFDRWKTNFGMTLPGAGGGSLSAAAVPEPTTIFLAVASLLGSMAFRRPSRIVC